MVYKFEVTQTIFKNIEVEADSKEAAMDKANEMLCDGTIRFDDEPYLKVECNIKAVD